MAHRRPRRPLMAGNWKMNLNHLEAIALVQKLAFSLDREAADRRSRWWCCHRSPTCAACRPLVDGDKLLIGYGAQDLSPHPSGAYTGEISGAMLAKLGCPYVVVGHSERRAYHHEDDALVNAKVKAALRERAWRRSCAWGRGWRSARPGEHVAHTPPQLDAALAGLSPAEVARVVVAYEPVWAIGTGKTATPEDAQEVIGALRARLAETLRRRDRRGGTDPLRRFGEGGEHRRDHGGARHRRRSGRRREPGRRRVRRDLPVR